MSIIHIRIPHPPLPLQRNPPQLLPRLHRLPAQRGIKVDDHRADQVVIKAIRKRGRSRIDRLHGARRVVLEQEETVIEPGLRRGEVRKGVKEPPVRGEVVGREARREAQRVVRAVGAGDAGVAVARQRGNVRVVRLDDCGVCGAEGGVHGDVFLGGGGGALVEHVHADEGGGGVDLGDALEPDEVDVGDVASAVVDDLVDEIEDRLELVVREDQVRVCPLRAAVIGHVVHLIQHLRDDAEIVAGALQTPEEIPVSGVLAGHHEPPVGEDHARLDELVGREPVPALEPAVAPAEHGADEGGALARARHGLLALRPEGVGDFLGERAAPDAGCAAVGAELDVVEALHGDLDAVFEGPEAVDGAVAAGDGEPGEAEAVC